MNVLVMTCAAVHLCFSAIFRTTGSWSGAGSVGSIMTGGLSGEPRGEYASNRTPINCGGNSMLTYNHGCVVKPFSSQNAFSLDCCK